MPNFDVAVVGGGIPALAAAALLAKASRKVVLMDPGESPGGAFAVRERDQTLFTGGPLFVQGFGSSGPVRHLYASVGLPVSADRSSPAYQVSLPDRRITVYPESEGTLEELRREFPQDIDRIVRLVRDLRTLQERFGKNKLAAALAKKRTAGRFLAAYHFRDELTAFFNVQARFFFGRDLGELSLADLVSLALVPPLFHQQGFHVLAEQLLDTFTSLGGVYKKCAEWPELHIRDRHIAPFRIGQEDFEARSILLNSPWAGERTLYLGISSQAVPVGMSRTVICLSEYSRPRDIFVLTLFTGGATTEARAAASSLTVTQSFRSLNVTPDNFLEQVRRIIPFLDQFLLFSSSEDSVQNAHPLCEQLLKGLGAKKENEPLLSARQVRRLYLIQDRTMALCPLIDAARQAAIMLS